MRIFFADFSGGRGGCFVCLGMTSCLSRCRAAAVLAFFFGLFAVANAAPVKFNIPAQPAPAALQLFIKQSGAQVMFVADEVKDVVSKPVAGDYEPMAALRLLLQGTGYTVTERKAGWFAVVRENTGAVRGALVLPGGAPAAGVLVVVRETGQSVEADKDGQFFFSAVAPGSHVLAVRAEGYQPLHITDVVVKAGHEVALSRETLRKPADGVTVLEPFTVRGDPLTELEKFEVSGSKQKPFQDANVDIPRTVNDAKPYYIFNDAVIEQTGAATVEEFLSKKLPMISSFTSGSKQSAAAVLPYTGTSSTVAMRGLSATQTLILMNGRRLPNVVNGTTETAPDLNSIPLGIIDRIEVLPSSASGIYGGGAVGGVINIITKRNYTGGEIKLTYDNTFDSDTAKRRVDLMYGLTLEGGRTHVMISANKSDANSLTVNERYELIRKNVARVAANNPAFFTGANTLLGTTPRIDSQNGVPLVLKAAFGGQSLGTPFLFVPAGYRGLAADGTAGLIAQVGKNDTDWPNTEQWYNGRQYAIYNLPQIESIRGEIRRQMLPALELFFSASYDSNLMDTVVSPSTYASQNGITVAATSPTNPFNQTVVVRFPAPDGEVPYRSLQIRRQLLGGFSLKLPHDWQVLGDYAWNQSAGSMRNNTPAFTTIAAAGNSGAIDPFIDLMRHPASDQVAPYISTTFTTAGMRMTSASLRGAGPLGEILGLKPTLAFGVEHREELRADQRIRSVNAALAAENFFSGSLGARQTITSYYAELTLPLLARERTFRGLRLLEVQLTGRRDDYTTTTRRARTAYSTPEPPEFDEPKVDYTSTNPTYGIRYKPLEDVMFRAAFAKGFLPPTATQLIPGVRGTFASTVTDPRRGNTSVAIIPDPSGGNPDLVPETSKNWSGGVVYTPKFLPGFRLAVDYVLIEKRNNIGSLGAQVIVNNEALFPERVTRGPVPAGDPYGVGPITGINTMTMNLYSTTVEAYDLSVGYQKATATWGTFGFDALGTVSTHYLQRITLGAPELEYVGTPSSAGPLKLRGNFTATWSRGPWQLGWTTTYYDDYKVMAAPFTTALTNVLNNGGPVVPSQTYHDVFARYRFGTADRSGAKWRRLLDRTELLVGVRNVFNKEPEFDGTSLTGFFFSPYGDARLASYTLSLKRAF